MTSNETIIPDTFTVPTTACKSLFYMNPGNLVDSLDNNHITMPYNKKTPYNKKGAIFSGLTPQSTFTVNVTWIIERIISSQDKTLSVLAKPSPAVDLVALQLYSEMVQKIPIGVRVKDNGFGDWFLGCVDEIAGVVSTIGKPIMSAVDQYRTSRKKKAAKAASKSVAATGNTYNPKPSYGSPMNVDLGDRSPAAKKRRNAKAKEKQKAKMALLRSVATPATMKAASKQRKRVKK